MLKQNLFIVLIISILSCNNNSKTDNGNTEFIKGVQITSDDTDFIGETILWIGDGMAVVRSSGGNSLCKLYKLNGDKLIFSGNLINKGSGPGELYSAYTAASDQYLSIAELVPGNAKMIRFHKDSLAHMANSTSQSHTAPTRQGMFSPVLQNAYLWIDDHRFLILNAPMGEQNVLSVSDLKTDSQVSSNLWFDDGYNSNNFVKQNVYSRGTLYRKPGENRFVYACDYGNYIEAFSLTEDYQVENRTVFEQRFPAFHTKDGINFTFTKEDLQKTNGIKYAVASLSYFYAIAYNPIYDADMNNFVYKGYSNSHSDTLQVYDWEGNHIKTIILELPAYSFSWDEKQRILYAITEAQDDAPNVLRAYQLE
ncbi:MAG: hypothetical protein Q4G08_04775 [Capnocytophaga sp.]|nr:hypothetical protein [Capnocytophaga sp.]